MKKRTPQEIKAARIKAGLSVARAAEMACVGWRTFYNYEYGRAYNASAIELFFLKLKLENKHYETPKNMVK